MNVLIRQSIKPQATRLSYLLLALVILGFGALAEHNAQPVSHPVETAQSFATKH